MGARLDCLTIHAWYWMQTRRVASSAGRAREGKRPKGRLPFPPGSEDVVAAAWLRLPPGVLFAGRLGSILASQRTSSSEVAAICRRNLRETEFSGPALPPRP